MTHYGAKFFSLAASFVLVALAGFEAVHDLSGNPWEGYTLAANWVGVVLVPIWISAGAYLVARPSQERFNWVIALALFATFVHFMVLKIGESPLAWVYLGGFAIVAAALGLRSRSIRKLRKRQVAEPIRPIREERPKARAA